MAERDPLDLAMEGDGVQPTVEEVNMEPMPADLRAHAAGNNTYDVVKFNLESGVKSRLQARQFLDLLVKTRPMVLDIGRRDDPAEVRLQQSIEVTKMMPRLSEAEQSGQRAVSAAASAAAVSPGMVAPLPKRFSTSAAGPSRADEEQWHPLSDPREAASIRAPLLFSCAACGSNPADLQADKLKTKPDDPEFKKLSRKQKKKSMHRSRVALARKTRNLCMYYMQCGHPLCRVCIENTWDSRCNCGMSAMSALGRKHLPPAAELTEVYCSCLMMSPAYAMVMFKATSALPLLGRPPCPRGPNCLINATFTCINFHPFRTEREIADARLFGVELGRVSEDISVVVRGRLFLNPDRSRDFTWMEHCPTTIGGLRVTDLVLNSPPFDVTFWNLLSYYQDCVHQQDDSIIRGGKTVASCLVRARICMGSTEPPIVEDVFDALEENHSEMKPMHILWLYALGLVC